MASLELVIWLFQSSLPNHLENRKVDFDFVHIEKDGLLGNKPWQSALYEIN